MSNRPAPPLWFREHHTWHARGWIPGSWGNDLTTRRSLGARLLSSQNPAWVLVERRQKRLVSLRSTGILMGAQELYRELTMRV